jgi:hypothetical protein
MEYPGVDIGMIVCGDSWEALSIAHLLGKVSLLHRGGVRRIGVIHLLEAVEDSTVLQA